MMQPFVTHDGITIDRPGGEVWLAGNLDKPTRYEVRGNRQLESFCYRGRVFFHRQNAVAYRREILLKRRAEIDDELKRLEEK